MFRHYLEELFDDADHESVDAYLASLQAAAERAASLADEHDDIGRN
jgi:hypothetical protein